MKDSLRTKLDKVSELAKIILLSSERVLPVEIRQEIENEQFRLEFRLKTLVDEARETEAHLKIESLQKVVNLLKTNETTQKAS